MLLAILAIWFGYKKGRDSGRNGVAWGAICGGAFIGSQFVFGLLIGAAIGIVLAASGSGFDKLDSYSWVISLGAIIPSIIVMLLIFKYLDRIPDDPVVNEPPPPPMFDQPE